MGSPVSAILATHSQDDGDGVDLDGDGDVGEL